jgi:hypothetical protein
MLFFYEKEKAKHLAKIFQNPLSRTFGLFGRICGQLYIPNVNFSDKICDYHKKYGVRRAVFLLRTDGKGLNRFIHYLSAQFCRYNGNHRYFYR